MSHQDASDTHEPGEGKRRFPETEADRQGAERKRRAAEGSRQAAELARTAAERARAAAEEARDAAEEARAADDGMRAATVDAVRVTAASLAATLDQMQELEQSRRALRDVHDPRKPDAH